MLFTRRRGGLVPSAEAIVLSAEIDRVFIELDRIAKTADRIRSRHHGRLRLVAMPR